MAGTKPNWQEVIIKFRWLISAVVIIGILILCIFLFFDVGTQGEPQAYTPNVYELGGVQVSQSVYSQAKNLARKAVDNTRNQNPQPIFVGVGLNDASSTGAHFPPVATTYTVIIVATGTPDVISKQVGIGPITTSTISSGNMVLGNGVGIKFDSQTGHTIGDKWFWTTNGGIDMTSAINWFSIVNREISVCNLPINVSGSIIDAVNSALGNCNQ